MRGAEAFLAAAGWGAASRVPLAGDASARRYERLSRGGESAVLMLAPPAERASFAAFTAMAAFLAAQGLSAPKVLAEAPEAGLMLLEDLGDDLLSRLADADPATEPMLYTAAADVLTALARVPPPQGLAVLSPEVMVEMTALTYAQLPPAAQAEAVSLKAAIDPVLHALFARHLGGPPVTILRDYHAGNLLWLPGRVGVARVGLLDFQDAVAGPAGYDLVSLLDDARRDVPEALKAELIAAQATVPGLSQEGMALRCAVLSVQRNLRILGVFARLAATRGKPAYLRHMPRVVGHVRRALAHPELDALRTPMERLLALIEAAQPVGATP